jgi:Tfp pilus assembly ATPase PilU
MEAGGSLGMQTMEHDLARLWVGGHLSENTALTLARNPTILRERAQLLRQQNKSTNAFRTPSGGVE